MMIYALIFRFIMQTYYKKNPLSIGIGSGMMLRGKGSNLRPSGYEPDELPLLYLAMFGRQSYANINS